MRTEALARSRRLVALALLLGGLACAGASAKEESPGRPRRAPTGRAGT